MTFCSRSSFEAGSERQLRQKSAGVVLVSLDAAQEAWLDPVADHLAVLLGWQRCTLASGQPDHGMTSLLEQAGQATGAWLAALTLDVGSPLSDGRCWAEVLGAWRQPTLLVVPASKIGSGVPAAATALLRQWRVPLVGLLQCGGPWLQPSRRADGLPWLGMLPDQQEGSTGGSHAEPEAMETLQSALKLALQRLHGELA